MADVIETDRTTQFVRLLKENGTWQEFEADWRAQCDAIGEDFEFYAGSTIAVVGDLISSEQKNAGVFGLKIDGSYAAMCQINRAGLPKYDSPVLRTRFMTLAPDYDLTDKSSTEYGNVLVSLLFEVVKLAITDDGLGSKHIKFHLPSPQDVPFFSALGRHIKERDVFASIETRGMWLYITRK